jgi:hypothetical protein
MNKSPSRLAGWNLYDSTIDHVMIIIHCRAVDHIL